MNKIKVMHIVTDMGFGGAGKYLLNICKYLDREKYELTVVVPKGSVLKSKVQQFPETIVMESNGIDRRSFSFQGVKELYKLMKIDNPEIVHSHACLSARIAAYLRGVRKTVYTRHSLLPPNRGLKKTTKVILSRILGSKAIAVSKAVKDNLAAEGERQSDIYLIYNGVELPDKAYEKEHLREKYRLSDKDIVITLVGRLNKVKGQEHLLKVTELLNSEINGFKVLLVGEGPERRSLENFVKEEILPVEFLGHINEIDEIYSLSDIVVNTSNSEAFPFAVLEAFSHKKPVVAFNVGGIGEAITNGQDGFLVDFLDYEQFSSRLTELMRNENQREEFGQRGFEKVKSEFAVEEMIKKIENVYGGI
ncbi:MAG: glycosyltransferase [Tissierellaceae bacterium]|nr:glycosyltransferase [Tissierellaceae bacterium]